MKARLITLLLSQVKDLAKASYNVIHKTGFAKGDYHLSTELKESLTTIITLCENLQEQLKKEPCH